jgi:hypothetical protein
MSRKFLSIKHAPKKQTDTSLIVAMDPFPSRVRHDSLGLEGLAEAAAAAEAVAASASQEVAPPPKQNSGAMAGSDEAAGHCCVPPFSPIQGQEREPLPRLITVVSDCKYGDSCVDRKRPSEGSMQSLKKKVFRRVSSDQTQLASLPTVSPGSVRQGSLSTAAAASESDPPSEDPASKASPPEGCEYVDYSLEPDEPSFLAYRGEESSFSSLTLAGIDAATKNAILRGLKIPPQPTFPLILHDILSNPAFQHIISWMPHGRAVRIWICS